MGELHRGRPVLGLDLLDPLRDRVRLLHADHVDHLADHHAAIGIHNGISMKASSGTKTATSATSVALLGVGA